MHIYHKHTYLLYKASIRIPKIDPSAATFAKNTKINMVSAYIYSTRLLVSGIRNSESASSTNPTTKTYLQSHPVTNLRVHGLTIPLSGELPVRPLNPKRLDLRQTRRLLQWHRLQSPLLKPLIPKKLYKADELINIISKPMIA